MIFPTQCSAFRRSSGFERSTRLLCLLAALTLPLRLHAQQADLSNLVPEIIVHQHAAENFRKQSYYSGHESRTEFDSHGNIRKQEERDLEATAEDGFQIIRTLRRNGHPLTEEEQRKDNESIRQQLARAREHKVHPPNSEIAVSRFLELGHLSNPRPATYDGRPALLLDYVGDPVMKVRNRFEEVTRCMAGTILVDEQDRSVIRVDGAFIRDFKIAGGLLVDIRKGTQFTVEQQRVQPSLWLPVRMDATGSLRALLFLNFNGSASATYSQYRGLTPADTLTAHAAGLRD
ncbi:hypothetical protein [Terriglobus tenax]|uniref:hypothetical protein n=1 Tax=Terriglobus tenax TaxID=1111115 RepID=UPI0021DF69CB|nr:hypothetical protein [Terriglobus tenax]